MKTTRKITIILLITFVFVGVSCKKEAVEEPQNAELKITLDKDSTREYSITGCDQIKIDSIKGNQYLYLTISGCGYTFQDSILGHYNCYPTYDYWGFYLYDDCYWVYY